MLLTFPVIGVWRPGQVRISWREPSSRKIVPEVEQIIDDTWQLAMKRPGVHLFDGPMCRLEALHAQPDDLQLTLSRTSYKIFMGTNLANAPLADTFGHQVLANPIGLSTVLISSDEQLMLGRRNARVAYYPRRVHPFAGCLEPSDNLDVFDDVLRELQEELQLDRQDISEIVCTGIAEDFSLRQPEICFVSRAKKTAAEIESTLDAGEHAGIWKTSTRRDAIEAALQSEEVFTPVAVAAMLLWGRTVFGEQWFIENNPHQMKE